MAKIFKLGAVLALALSAITIGMATADAQTTDDIDRIKERGTLRVGFAESVPFQFKDPQTGEWIGFNADLSKELAEILGVNLEVVDATWATLIPGLMTDKFDIVMVDMFSTPQRAATVVFTDPYFYVAYQVVVAKDSAYATWEDVDKPGNIFAQVSGTFDEQLAKQYFPKAQVKPFITDNNNTVFIEVANGNAASTVMTGPSIEMFIAKNPTVNVKVLQPERVVAPQGNSYAIRPGNYHLLNMLNTWIAFNKDSEKIEELRKKWFETWAATAPN